MQAVTLELNHVLFLPDFMVGVFKHLSLKDMEKAVLVCKNWHAIADEHFIWNHMGIRKALPANTKIVWIKDWEDEGIACQDVRPIDKLAAIRDVGILQSLDRNGLYLCGIVPQGLTLRKIKEIAVRHGITLNFHIPPHPNAPDELMDVSNPCAYIAATTGYALGHRMSEKQRKILTGLPDVSILPATAFAIFRAIHNKECLHIDLPLSCAEEFHKSALCIEYRAQGSEFLVNNLSYEMGFGGVGAQIVFK
jgi:hypothetical protein